MGIGACRFVVILFRNCPPGRHFYSERVDQRPARWHGDNEGPAQYLATTPDAAWAEYLRHEGISDPLDLPGIERALWAIEVDEDIMALPSSDLPVPTLLGEETTYPDCRAEAQRLRDAGHTGLRAMSAAVDGTTPSGNQTNGGLVAGPIREELTVALFGLRPGDMGWMACAIGRPSVEQLLRVRHLKFRVSPGTIRPR
jgi:hypothetical protein